MPSPNRVRIIGGRHRGRVLRFPGVPGLRPTPDRVRETLFNWLGQDLTGRATLEPYAGSGALSLEALSRGAALAVAVDREPALVHALEPAFVPWAKPFGPWLLWHLAQHPKFVGGKISTLDEPHFLYWAAMCKDLKLDFAPHSGDDFGICTAIRLGLP